MTASSVLRLLVPGGRVASGDRVVGRTRRPGPHVSERSGQGSPSSQQHSSSQAASQVYHHCGFSGHFWLCTLSLDPLNLRIFSLPCVPFPNAVAHTLWVSLTIWPPLAVSICSRVPRHCQRLRPSTVLPLTPPSTKIMQAMVREPCKALASKTAEGACERGVPSLRSRSRETIRASCPPSCLDTRRSMHVLAARTVSRAGSEVALTTARRFRKCCCAQVRYMRSPRVLAAAFFPAGNHPRPETLNPKLQTLNPKIYTLNSKP